MNLVLQLRFLFQNVNLEEWTPVELEIIDEEEESLAHENGKVKTDSSNWKKILMFDSTD